MPFARLYTKKPALGPQTAARHPSRSAPSAPVAPGAHRPRRITAALAATAALVLGPAACGEDRPRLSADAQQAMPVPEKTGTTTQPAADASPAPRRAGRAKPQAPRTTTAPAATTAANDAGGGDAAVSRFVAAVQKQIPAVAIDRRDEEVEELGEEACAGLAAGKKPAAVAGALGDDGVATADARKLVTIAGQDLCRS